MKRLLTDQIKQIQYLMDFNLSLKSTMTLISSRIRSLKKYKIFKTLIGPGSSEQTKLRTGSSLTAQTAFSLSSTSKHFF